MLTENQWCNLARDELASITAKLRDLCMRRAVTERADQAAAYSDLQEALEVCERAERSILLVDHTRPYQSCEAGTCRHQECARQRRDARRAAREVAG